MKTKSILGYWGGALCALQVVLAAVPAQADALRPPAAPLVACDPYVSIWSPADKLNGAETVHWTGKPHRLRSVARIDGTDYRIMGGGAAGESLLEQKSLTVLPTRTIYTFEGAGVGLTLTFLTPALPESIDILSRPVTYVTYELRSTDGKSHTVGLSLAAAAEIAVNEPSQEVVLSIPAVDDSLRAVRVGSRDQPVLMKKGDDLRIDWGYLYLSAPAAQGCSVSMTPKAGAGAQEAQARAAGSSISLQFNEIQVTSQPVTRWMMLAYDDIYSIQYMQKNLRPYWRRNGWEAADLLKASATEYGSLLKRCIAFDTELMADLTKAGGENYAQICALSYRHCFAAGKFVADAKGQPLQFCKENHSNGCIGTSDVFYPMAPQFLFFGPSLAKSFLVPFMEYAASSRWKFPFAPHDLGTYPKANGQVYGGGERTEENQMPVEETGNLMILMGAIAQMEGNTGFADRYWPQLEKWAEYLKAKGFDPENQLCTDDFAGHLAHNVNLSVKAICGLGSFGKLCRMKGDAARADEYFTLARQFAQRWVKEADDGTHFRLAFDRPNSWSQKYNLVWDRILGLNLFPAEVARKEMDFYKTMQNRYGLPLDNRKAYTKLDWILWTATLTQDRSDFDALVKPLIVYINETPDRAPMSDWYQSDSAKKVGFTARPVVGGVFLQMLYNEAVWKKYASRDETRASGWALMPQPPKVRTVVPAADTMAAVWRYTTARPAADWFKPAFDASQWREGKSGFGTAMTPGSVVGTVWNTDEIWLRREIELPENKALDLQAWLHHDENVEVYINGVLALRQGGFTSGYETFQLNGTAKAALKPGKNTVAVHCRQTQGGQYVDLGFVQVEPN